MSAFYETKVYVRGIVLVLDGPRDGIGRGQVGRIIDEGLDDWAIFFTYLSRRSRNAKNIRLTAARA